jgi:FkbM family methyltransferase
MKRLPHLRGKIRAMEALLPRQGTYLSKAGKYPIELDFSDRYERLAALGVFASTTVKDIISNLKPGECFCDCGAHIGVVSLMVASYLGDGGQVYAFEPAPSTFRRLETSFSLTNSGKCKLEAFPVAVGAQSGKATIHVSSQHGWSTLSEEAVSVSIEMGASVTQVEEVPVQTLDDFFFGPKNRRFPQAIKIDVEGWEEHVLIGARRLLEENPPRIILIEKNDRILATMGRDFRSVHEFLLGYGYANIESFSTEDELYRI